MHALVNLDEPVQVNRHTQKNTERDAKRDTQTHSYTNTHITVRHTARHQDRHDFETFWPPLKRKTKQIRLGANRASSKATSLFLVQ